jgi:hypothetical protein
MARHFPINPRQPHLPRLRPIRACGAPGRNGVSAPWQSNEDAPAEAWLVECTEEIGPRRRALVPHAEIVATMRYYRNLGALKRVTLMQRCGPRYYDDGACSFAVIAA